MAHCHIDHIVITAPSLKRGEDFVSRELGVQPQAGGEHPRMGTHNLLLRLGGSMYLEVIAPNPSAAQPMRPRWFELDKLTSDSEPRLATWVARTQDIHTTRTTITESLGEIEQMIRGSLQWLITIPADGCMPLGGLAPSLIEWQSEVHPASTLLEKACSLERLELFHPDPIVISAILESLGVSESVHASACSPHMSPFLVAHIRTPAGLRRIGPHNPPLTSDSTDTVC